MLLCFSKYLQIKILRPVWLNWIEIKRELKARKKIEIVEWIELFEIGIDGRNTGRSSKKNNRKIHN